MTCKHDATSPIEKITDSFAFLDPHAKFFVSTPIPTSSVQETSDEGSIQFDSSSEEARVRYVIKVTPSRRDRDNAVAIEVNTHYPWFCCLLDYSREPGYSEIPEHLEH